MPKDIIEQTNPPTQQTNNWTGLRTPEPATDSRFGHRDTIDYSQPIGDQVAYTGSVANFCWATVRYMTCP
jgi:hypothetical protein